MTNTKSTWTYEGMKVFYSRPMTGTEMVEIRHKLEDRFHCSFDAYSVRGGARFLPVVTDTTPEDAGVGNEIIRYIPANSWINFFTLAKVTGRSLNEILRGAAWLLKERRIAGQIDRLGKVGAVSKGTYPSWG